MNHDLLLASLLALLRLHRQNYNGPPIECTLHRLRGNLSTCSAYLVNMSSSGDDDAPKKRDCDQVVLQEQEQPKKQVRVNDGKAPSSSSSSSSAASSKARTLSPPRRVLVRDANHASIPQTSNDPHVAVWDLESALQYIVSVDTKNESLNDTTTVSFRVGHAGDASTISNLYQQSQAPKSPEFTLRKTASTTTTTTTTTTNTEPEEESSSLLELWLAEGMGDEDTPPSLHVLLAHIQNGSGGGGGGGGVSGPSQLAAIALLTISWEEDTRMLRVEWLYLDPSLDRPVGLALERRLWLRLSSCALLTACQLVQIEEDLTSVGDDKTVTETSRLPPSAE